jgi:hypothetical protein
MACHNLVSFILITCLFLKQLLDLKFIQSLTLILDMDIEEL